MSKGDADRINQIVQSALALPEEERYAYVKKVCTADRDELAAVLASLNARKDVTPESTEAPPPMPTQAKAVAKHDRAGEWIGSYHVLELIGSGGFGDVYVADQVSPVRRRVALKVLKPGMDTKAVLARFEAERQALALMDHPNVAKILDAGQTGRGQPYFVMEWVKGESITAYCDRNKLTTKQRLRLCMQVCGAVQHAHQKGIIHRDLKPSNILVADNEGNATPKVIDFGIAKATFGVLSDLTLHTRQGELIGTPAYMSPEQMSGLDIDTRSDVYSLGVLLYKVLTGVLPFDLAELKKKGYAEVQRVLREEQPPKPSQRVSALSNSEAIAKHRGVSASGLARQVKGELDWIILKSMEKDRSRRYQTVSELEADLDRFLAGQAVQAGPPSAMYRFRKLAGRHKLGLVTAAAIAATVIGALIQSNLQRIKVEQAREELEAVTAFQTQMLQDIVPEQLGEWLIEDIANRVAESNRQDGATESEIASAMVQFSESVEDINLTDAALTVIDRNILSRALAALRANFSERPLMDARLRSEIAETYHQLGMYDKARPLIDNVLDTRMRLLGPDDPLTLAAMSDLGYLLQDQGELTAAEPYFREALEGRRKQLGDDHEDTWSSVNNLGVLLANQGNLEEAEPYFLETFERRRDGLGKDHPKTLASVHNLGALLHAQGKLDLAELRYHEALEGRRRVFGEGHAQTLETTNNLAVLYSDQGRHSAAEPYYRAGLAGNRRVLGNEHPRTLAAISNMGELMASLGRIEEAEAYYREAVVGSTSVLGNNHPHTLGYLKNLGDILLAQSKLEEAEKTLAAMWQGATATLGKDQPDRGRYAAEYGRSLAMLQQFERAEPLLLEAHEILVRTEGSDSDQTRLAVEYLVELYAAWERPESLLRWQSAASSL